jgi:hypothetical protein
MTALSAWHPKQRIESSSRHNFILKNTAQDYPCPGRSAYRGRYVGVARYLYWYIVSINIYEVGSKTNETFVVVAHSRIGEICWLNKICRAM